jgi:ABC-type dipeptide/oligopeptide/nickel transport system permease component
MTWEHDRKKILGLFFKTAVEIAVGTLFIYTIVFFAVSIIPVDPARAIIGPYAPESALAAVREQFGLDHSLPVQYFLILKQLLHGNFGTSFYFNQPALEVLRQLAPLTLGRGMAALLLGSGLGLLFSLILANRRWYKTQFLLGIFYAVPSFCVMLILLWVTARTAGITPAMNRAVYEFLAIAGSSLFPMGTVAAFMLARLDLCTGRPRHVDFLLMLNAPRSEILRIIWRESLPGAAAIAINSIPAVLTAVTFSEYIFGLSGFGVAYIKASSRADLPLVVAGAALIGLILLIGQKISEALVQRFDIRRLHA